MNARRNLTDRLRDQIVSAIHVGRLRGGDRLPSIRQVAKENDEDARAVARAYRVLEAEGLVEVRERSGIYAIAQARIGGMLLEETAQWAARVLVEAWKRGVAVSDVPEFFRRCTAVRKVRCAFVEASKDVITAFTHDLREHLGVDAHPVWLDSLPRSEPGMGLQKGRIPPVLRAADLVVTTAFHAREVAPLADAFGKPLIAATVHPDMVAAVERRLRSGGLTVICVDPGFGHRMRIQYQELITAEDQLRLVYADDRRGIAALNRTEPVLLTRAARNRIGEVNLPLVFPHSPTISPSSALEVAEFVIRFNLEAEAGQQRSSRNHLPESHRSS